MFTAANFVLMCIFAVMGSYSVAGKQTIHAVLYYGCTAFCYYMVWTRSGGTGTE